MVALNSVWLIGIAIISVAIYYLFFKDKHKGKKQPPGPRGFPFFGSIFSLGDKPHIAFTKWAQTYGPIFKVQLGNNSAVVINEAKLIKEAFNDPTLIGRPDFRMVNILAGGKVGILNADGDGWAEQRRFTLRTLRDFGFGKKNMEEMIMEEVNEIIGWLKRSSGEGAPIVLNRKFQLAVLNSLWNIITSERYSHDDPKLSKMLDASNESFKEVLQSPIPLFFPDFAERFPRITGWNKLLKASDPLITLFKSTVENRLKDPGDENNPRDFLDVYINEINKTTDPNSTFYKQNGIKSLKAIVGDLHGAGSETTATTISWAVLYLMKNSKIQEKFQTELDTVIGKSRLPCLADRSNMPYTEALMAEILRYSALVPIGVMHNAMVDTEFHGYFIPKDTWIIANHYNAHHNKESWIDPENFRPERFLSKDGKSVIKNESLIPFSSGKRVCLGESLARDEFFLFMTSIFQRFQVSPDPAKPASLEAEFRFINIPKPFSVLMKDRFE